jgi:hypothetical protein
MSRRNGDPEKQPFITQGEISPEDKSLKQSIASFFTYYLPGIVGLLFVAFVIFGIFLGLTWSQTKNTSTCVLSQDSGNGNSPCSCTTSQGLFSTLTTTLTNLFNLLGVQITSLATTLGSLNSTTNTVNVSLTSVLYAINGQNTLITSTSQSELNNITLQLAAFAAALKSAPCSIDTIIDNPPYSCHLSEDAFFDPSRTKSGAYTPSTPGRMITQPLFRPSLFKGTGAPIGFPEVRFGHGGAYAAQGYPNFTSTRTIPMQATWTDNVPISDPRPLIIASGGGGGTANIVPLAEHLCRQGWMVVIWNGVGVDTRSCPTASPQCGTAAAGIFGFNDERAAYNLTLMGLNPSFPLSLIKINATDGKPIIATIGGSAGGNSAIQFAAGLGDGAALNGFPPQLRLNEALPEVRGVFVGDTHLPSNNAFVNFTDFRAPIVVYNHGLQLNWDRSFYKYANSSRRIFIQPKMAIHQISDFSGKVNCVGFRECVRVYQQGVNTTVDNLSCPSGFSIFGVAAQLAHCNPGTITGFSSIPGTTYTGAAGAAVEQLSLRSPTSGISAEEGSDVENLQRYYATLFFRWVLDGDVTAGQLVAQNKYPNLLLGVYDNQVPGFARNSFNLQNRTIQFDLSPDGTYHAITITNRTGGAITDPSSTPGIVRLSPLATFSRSTAPPPAAIQLAMGSFPLPSGGNALINSTQYFWPTYTGYVSFVGGRAIIDHVYQAPRLGNWMAQSGIATFAMFGAPIGSFGAVNATSPVNKIWVENTASYLRITHFGVSLSNSVYPGYFNFRTTFFPNGTIVQEFDGTIPSNIFELDQRSAAGVVGYSSGRLYIDPSTGKYNPALNPKMRTFNDLLSGTPGVFDTRNDAAYEVFNAPESAAWAA